MPTHLWQKGESGNPKGRPTNAERERRADRSSLKNFRPLLHEWHEWKGRFKSKPFYWRRTCWRQVDPADEATKVRASFLRFLALGGDESTPIHERGIQLTRAFVLGNLELEDIDVNYPLVLNNGTVNLMVVMRRLSGKRK